MEITCPHCDFSGTIQDGLIPGSGSAVTCPKCKKKFFVSPEIPVMEADDPMNATLSTPSAPADTPAAAPSGRRKGARKDTVKTLFVAFGLIFGMFLCFIAGRLSVGSNPLAAPPAAPAKPAAPKPAEGPSVTGGAPADLSLIVLPEERFTGAETLDVASMDKEISDISALADPEKTAKMRELAEGLTGKNVTGVYRLLTVQQVVFFFDAMLPKGSESRYLEAESDTTSPAHARIFLTVSGKADEIAAIEKAKKVSVTGFIVNCRVASDGLDMALANAQVRAAR